MGGGGGGGGRREGVNTSGWGAIYCKIHTSKLGFKLNP